MNKKLLEQIKNMPGVKTVEPTGHGLPSVVVVFEPEIEYIQCNTDEEYNFLCPIIHDESICIYSKWEDFSQHPVWIYDKGVTTIKPVCGVIDAYEYLTPHLIGEFHNYMIKQAEKRFPDGCTIHWSSDNITHRDIRKPFQHMGEHIQDSFGKWLWCENEGWAELVKEKPEEKNLDKYEKILMDWQADGMNVFGQKYMVYSWLKKNKPEVYWREVLKLIADELNEGYSMSKPYHIGFKKENGAPYVTGVSGAGRTPGEVIFWSEEATKEAINIMGDKLRYLNGQPTPKG